MPLDHILRGVGFGKRVTAGVAGLIRQLEAIQRRAVHLERYAPYSSHAAVALTRAKKERLHLLDRLNEKLRNRTT